MTQRAIIYCRVSSKKQTVDGSGLQSQEHRCREYAQRQGYEVDAVFPDDVSGGGDFMKRPGMVALLSYLEAKSDTQYVVIFDDLKRFARDTFFHLMLRERLEKFGAQVECLNFRFDDTPEGRYVETVIAAGGQLERQQMARQTHQKTVARLEQGYWALKSPLGYKFEDTRAHGNLLVRDEPLASIIQTALQGYADGTFASQGEVKRYLESCEEYPKGKNGKIHFERIKELLTRSIYAGIVEMPLWGIAPMKGHHEGLVSVSTFEKIQARLAETAKAPMRRDLNEDFPLRGAVCCACGTPYTACWATGRNAKYPYYLCQEKGCEHYGKSVKRDELESRFEALLLSLKPSPVLFGASVKAFSKQWEHRMAQIEHREAELAKKRQDVEVQIEKLLDRIVDSKMPRVIETYESKIEKLERDKLLIDDQVGNMRASEGSFDETFRTALRYVADPHKVWANGQFEDKRAVVRLTFGGQLTYVRNEGFRTAEIDEKTFIFSQLGGSGNIKTGMVPERGLEPPTNCLRSNCSTT